MTYEPKIVNIAHCVLLASWREETFHSCCHNNKLLGQIWFGGLISLSSICPPAYFRSISMRKKIQLAFAFGSITFDQDK